MMDRRAIRQAVGSHYGSMPHPDVPDVTIAEHAGYERASYFMHEKQLSGARPSPEHVAHAFHTLKNMDMSPGEFEHLWTTARPMANRLLNRDPSMFEISMHRGRSVQEIHQHYLAHPYPGYEEVTAGQMARYMRAAEPIARHHGQTPSMEEVSRFAVSGYGTDDMHRHYGGEF